MPPALSAADAQDSEQNIRMSSIPWQSANKDLKTPRLALP